MLNLKPLLFCFFLLHGGYIYSQNINYQFVEAESDLRIFFYNKQGEMYDSIDVFLNNQKLIYDYRLHTYVSKNINDNTTYKLKAYYADSLICDLDIRKNIVTVRYYPYSWGYPTIKWQAFYLQEEDKIYKMTDTIRFAKNYDKQSMYLYAREIGLFSKNKLAKLKPDKDGYISFVPKQFDAIKYEYNKPIEISLNKEKKDLWNSEETIKATFVENKYQLNIDLPKTFYAANEPVNFNLSLSSDNLHNEVCYVVISARVKDVKELHTSGLFIPEIIWQDTIKLKVGEKIKYTLPDSLLYNPVDAVYEINAGLKKNKVTFNNNVQFFCNYNSAKYEKRDSPLKTALNILKDSVEVVVNNQNNIPVWYTLRENGKQIADTYSDVSVKAKYKKKSKGNYVLYVSYLQHGKMYMNYIDSDRVALSEMAIYYKPFSFNVNDNLSPEGKNDYLKIGMYPGNVYIPKFNGATHTVEIADTSSSIIPVVIYGGDDQVAQLVWIDGQLVYDYCADNVGKEISVKPGKHHIRLRAAKRDVYLNDFEIKDCVKTFLYVNADSLMKINPEQSVLCNTHLPEKDSDELKRRRASISDLHIKELKYKDKTLQKKSSSYKLFFPLGMDSIRIKVKDYSWGTKEKTMIVKGGNHYVDDKIIGESSGYLCYSSVPSRFVNEESEKMKILSQYINIIQKSRTHLNVIVPDEFKSKLSHVVLKENNGDISVYTESLSNIPVKDNDAHYTLFLLFGGRQVYTGEINIKANGKNYLNVDASQISGHYSNAFTEMLDKLTEGKKLVEIEILDEQGEHISFAHIKMKGYPETPISINTFNRYSYLWLDADFEGPIEIRSLGYVDEFIHYKKGQNFISVKMSEVRLSTAW